MKTKVFAAFILLVIFQEGSATNFPCRDVGNWTPTGTICTTTKNFQFRLNGVIRSYGRIFEDLQSHKQWQLIPIRLQDVADKENLKPRTEHQAIVNAKTRVKHLGLLPILEHAGKLCEEQYYWPYGISRSTPWRGHIPVQDEYFEAVDHGLGELFPNSADPNIVFKERSGLDLSLFNIGKPFPSNDDNLKISTQLCVASEEPFVSFGDRLSGAERRRNDILGSRTRAIEQYNESLTSKNYRFWIPDFDDSGPGTVDLFNRD